MDETWYLRRSLYMLPSAAILTLETSNVSVSTNTISLLAEKDGTVISLTICPAGPCITLVPNSGWHPTT